MRLIAKGATSQTIYVEVKDSSSTTGGTLTGLVFNTASLVASYARNGAARVAITLATQTAAGAWSSGGFVAVDGTNMPGVYRLDVPDAAFASGADSVVITLRGATNMVQVSEEVQLTSVNLQDSVRSGMTALPNAAAEAAGGLYTRGSGAGQINQNASGQVDTRAVALAAGVIASGSFAAGAIDASAIATDAIGSAELAASAITEIAGGVWDEARASHTTAGSFGQGVASVQGNVTGSAASVTGAIGSVTGAVGSVTGNVGGNVTGSVGSVASGGITTASFAAGAINAAAIAADAIGASELAADAVAEIADGVWDEVISGHLTVGTTGAALNGAGSGATAPTSAQNAAAVWDLAISGHTTSGTFGNKVNGLSSGGSGGPVGSGSTAYTVTVTQPNGVTPIEGVACWVSTDAAGTNVVAGTLYTDTLGRINSGTGFMLDPGNYYLWRQHGRWTFSNPTSFTVT